MLELSLAVILSVNPDNTDQAAIQFKPAGNYKSPSHPYHVAVEGEYHGKNYKGEQLDFKYKADVYSNLEFNKEFLAPRIQAAFNQQAGNIFEIQ